MEPKKEDEKEEGDEDLGVPRGLPPADANWWESGERRGEKWWEGEGRRGGGEERRRGENL